MKKSLLLVVLFCFLAANTVLAQGKTAVIDMQAVTLQSKAGMKAVEELKALEEGAVKFLRKLILLIILECSTNRKFKFIWL